jgi:bifunctional DNA-binding transcriptional regulator/antitoxin component of YhaV-PrlF toxin-antitoxin module
MKRTAFPYESKVDSRGRVWICKAMRDQMGLPNGGFAAIKINDDGEIVLRAHRDNHQND